MKNTLLINLLTFTFSLASIACELETYPHIYKLSATLSDDLIIKTNCTDDTKNKILQFLSAIEGRLNSRILSTSLKLKEDFLLLPKVINVYNTQALLNKQLGDKYISFANTTSLYSNSFIGSKKSTPQVIFECKNCSQVGEKNIRFKIDKTSTWLSSTLLKKTSGYKAKQSIPLINPVLNMNDFEKVTVNTQVKTPLFTDIKNIRFYQLTKNLSANDLLSVNNLTLKTIISRGQKIRVSIKNKNVKIETIGIAMKSGKIGDFIQVKNPKSNKITLAKVIDFNKVHIEL
jgi:flagella basal body P-ring formation protein FlgA